MNRTYEKYSAGVVTLENGLYADSIPNFYYPMLFATTALLTLKNKELKAHAGILGLFGKEFVLNDDFDKDIIKYFSQSETLRDLVDYNAFNGVTKKNASERKRECELFLKECNRIFIKYGREDVLINF